MIIKKSKICRLGKEAVDRDDILDALAVVLWPKASEVKCGSGWTSVWP